VVIRAATARKKRPNKGQSQGRAVCARLVIRMA
jgi:hypothetical protein